MIQFALKRIWQSIPVILGVIIITFVLMYIIPGDPVVSMVGERFDESRIEELRNELHLNEPLWKQFLVYMGNVIQGDFGRSFITDRPVMEDLLDKLPNTAMLAAAAMFFAVFIGVGIGIISSLRPNTILDRGIMIFALAGISTPVFWLGLMLALFFGVYLQWLPPTGFGGLEYLILPAITLGLRSAAYLARITRASMLDVLNKDYIRTARSKRLPEWKVVLKHALPNAFIPVITVIGTDFGSYLSGAVLTESIFGWPGIGRFALDAILKRDFPVIQGTVLFMAIVFICANLVVDILYGVIDPRIRAERSNHAN